MRALAGHLALLAPPLLWRGELPPAAVLFLLLALGFGVAESRAQIQERVDREPLAIVSGLALLALFWVGLAVGDGALSPSAFTGALLMVAGIGARVAAIRTLGPWFGSSTTAMPGQPLLRSGPYAYARHPSELGLLAVAFGAALLLGSLPAALLAMGIVLPTSILRALREERALCYHPPDALSRV
jgi:protein-S-isoprenylcysteine O-methyltransferase Ste14